MLPHIFLPEIFEYLLNTQIWDLQCLNKNVQKVMKQHKWNKIIKFKETIEDNELIKIISDWNILNIDLSNCKKITDKSVKLLGNCYSLNLSHCRQITNTCITTYLSKVNVKH